eukprot:GHVU01169756.1.p1 GENE.GHVU01169756.1~~GHVU01169756.1.p1  ORF type:complete len:195 (+),score=15.27 GHVU01169756.1:631-1215(+)
MSVIKFDKEAGAPFESGSDLEKALESRMTSEEGSRALRQCRLSVTIDRVQTTLKDSHRIPEDRQALIPLLVLERTITVNVHWNGKNKILVTRIPEGDLKASDIFNRNWDLQDALDGIEDFKEDYKVYYETVDGMKPSSSQDQIDVTKTIEVLVVDENGTCNNTSECDRERSRLQWSSRMSCLSRCSVSSKARRT